MVQDLNKENIDDKDHEKINETSEVIHDNEEITEIVEEVEQSIDEQELIALKNANHELQNKLLRSYADIENNRKRAEKSLEDSNKYAISNFAKDVIRVADNIERALQAVDAMSVDEKLIEDFKTGLMMTQKELNTIFEKHAICLINPEAGEVFDHNEHQAVTQMEVADIKSGCIASVMQVGYKVHDRLLRPAMVAVAK